MTPSERILENAGKRQRAAEQREAAALDGWRIVDPNLEFFLMNDYSPEKAFASFKMRNRDGLNIKMCGILSVMP